MRRPQETNINQGQIDALMSLYTQGRLQDTLAEAVMLAEQYPNAPFIPNLIGAVYMGLGQKEKAVTSFQRALELKPDAAERDWDQ